MEFDALSNRVIGLMLEVHRGLGPGLLESAYQACLAHEMKTAGIGFAAEVPLPVRY
jgi:GxxExxY protein